MHALQLRKPALVAAAPLQFVERPDPEPEADELVTAVVACAVCRTDLQLAEGDLEPHRLASGSLEGTGVLAVSERGRDRATVS